MGKKLGRVVIKEELVALTGDFRLAIVLNQMIYWSERMKDVDKYVKEEKERFEKFSVDGENAPTITLSNGWVYKKAEELSDETMMNVKPKAMREYLKALVENGWLSERRNPYNKMDRVLQYRVNMLKIQFDLFNLGYALEGYSLPLKLFGIVYDRLNQRNVEKENTKVQADESSNDAKGEKENTKAVLENRKVEKERAIPKSTSKTNTIDYNKEFKPSYSPNGYSSKPKGKDNSPLPEWIVKQEQESKQRQEQNHSTDEIDPIKKAEIDELLRALGEID